MMDSRSLTEPNVHPTNIFKYQYELQGQTVSITHSPDQRWYYLDQQQTNEVTFIKIWDNQDNAIAKREENMNLPSKKGRRETLIGLSTDGLCYL